MTMYAIHAVESTECMSEYGTYTGMRDLPTFYLDARVQGIVSEEHAATIAMDLFRGRDVTLTAYKVPEGS